MKIYELKFMWKSLKERSSKVKQKKISKGTGHGLSITLIIIFAIIWIICKIMDFDSQSLYEVMTFASYAPILAIGIELGMELAKQED